MIGKFISKALASVLMDKRARENLERKKKKKKPRKPVAAPAPAASPAPEPTRAIPPAGTETEDVHQLIMDSLRAAEEELAAKPEMTSERQALIQQALEIQRSKEYVLEDLSQHER
ncbi:MAG: hypothetical protein O3B76_07710 [Proteobacteria bacterium]|nr:hypothetical protein [Pseudomonadota bacterium]MDA1023331.1 hypothetical protein [Pseudomonadota bacterium]